ncbi:MAG: nucleotidyltransferase family protein [Xanthomonadaceae bacterium]|nr:nucleotidyltransferase family protein [Xanthomonadaceae bacterium]
MIPSDHRGPVIVLLAAGEGRRFGGIKQLVELEGEPMCRRVARQLLASGLPLVVVTGAHADRVESSLAGLPLQIVRHGSWARGLGSSIAHGARRVQHDFPGASGALVCLADQPLLDAAHVERLLARHRHAPGRLLATRHEGVGGPPVLFPAAWLDELAGCDGPDGARRLLASAGTDVDHLTVAEHPDVDTPEDLRHVRDRLAVRPAARTEE